MEEDQIIEERKRKVKAFFTNNYNWVAYVILAIIVYLSVRIRTANLSKLKDVTTGTWTLGPDLDPFLFLRWAKYIVEHGSLYVIDSMRYVPLGFPTKWELLLHPYMMAWFHKLLFALGLSDSITYSAIVYPVFFFAITVVAFFLLVRKIFVDSLGNAKSNIVALIASFFLTIIPALLPRTIAGIPEKESAAFFFLFMAFYLFLSAWKAKKIRNQIVLSVLAGAFSAGMSLVWGGSAYVFLIISPAVLISFIFGSTDKKKVLIYLIWVFSSFVLMYPFSLRYTPINLISSTTTGVSVFVLFAILVHMAIFETRLNGYYNSSKASKIPPKIFSFLVSIVLVVVLASLIFGLNFVPEKINGVLNDLVTPATSRLIQTVAENRQPYFKEWESSFGPHIKDVALTFWLFFFGSIYLFYSVIKMFSKKEKLVLTMAYFIFLFSLIFSRYSSESVFNGTNGISLMLYAAGFLVFLITTGCFYYKNYRAGQESKFVEIDFGIILLFIFFLLCVVSARGAVRLIMMLVPSASIMVGYFTVALFNYAKKATDATAKMIAWCVFCIVLIAVAFSGYTYYNVSISEAAGLGKRKHPTKCGIWALVGLWILVAKYWRKSDGS